jgi:hypothetical protein
MIISWNGGLSDEVSNHPGVARAVSFFQEEVFKTDLFPTSQLQLMPHLQKLKILPFVINYIPVEHNCNFGAAY